MAGTVEATVTAEKTDMWGVCNTHWREHMMWKSCQRSIVVLLWGRPEKWK